MRQTLKQSKFLGGDKLNYADIAVAGNFLVHMATTCALMDLLWGVTMLVMLLLLLPVSQKFHVSRTSFCFCTFGPTGGVCVSI